MSSLDNPIEALPRAGHRPGRRRAPTWLAIGLGAWLVGGCASTTVTLSPAPQAPVCDPAASALVVWAPAWRPDQKDVAAREAAAAAGLGRFFASSGCFARTALRRVDGPEAFAASADPAAAGGPFDTVVTIAVRELGPVVRLMSSAALVEGGTEAVLQVTARRLQPPGPPRAFTIHWQHGGPGVVKGVASLPDDIGAALRSGLQPAAARP